VARPLREQFILAILLFVLPVGAVVAYSVSQSVDERMTGLREEAGRLARAIAGYADRTGGAAPGADLQAYLGSIQLPPGTLVTVTGPDDRELWRFLQPGSHVTERVRQPARATQVPWLVSVELPTALAWERATPLYDRAMGLAVLAAVIMLLLDAVFVHRWRQSLKRLEHAADAVGRGDLRTPPRSRMSAREFEHLRDAFSGMVDHLREARAAIARQVEEERRIREALQSLQKQVIRQERLAAIGVLLSGIAHELNNPLQAIGGHAELLQREARVPPDVQADLALIQKESARASSIIRNLSRFGRQQSSNPAPVRLSSVVASVVELRQRRLHGLGIALDLDEQSVGATMAVFTELQQVVLNFVINAEQAIVTHGGPERRLIIRTRDSGTGVRLEVEDTGGGVPPEHEAKLFQPFFTTKPVGEGTGLGLSVSYDIIRGHNGAIGCNSGERGAVFYFELPVASMIEGGGSS
jgi:two-component system, NtrC family, sensor kinase